MLHDYRLVIEVDYFGESGYRNSEGAINQIESFTHDLNEITADDFDDWCTEWSEEAMTHFNCRCRFTIKIFDKNADTFDDEPLKIIEC